MASTDVDVEEDSARFLEESHGFRQKNLKRRLSVMASLTAAVVAISLVVVVYMVTEPRVVPPPNMFNFSALFNSSLQPTNAVQAASFSSNFFFYSDNVGLWRKTLSNVSQPASLIMEWKSLVSAPCGLPADHNVVSSAVSVSPDGQLILLPYHRQQLWGRSWSFTAAYAVATLQSPFLCQIISAEPNVQTATWSAASDVVFYVRGNNVFSIQPFAPAVSSPNQWTFDGTSDQIISNGVMSWVYEEEIFSRIDALWPSPARDTLRVASLRFNHSLVVPFSFPSYSPSSPWTSQVSMWYPFPGTPNPLVSLLVLEQNSQRQINIADDLIVGVAWSPDGSNLLVVGSDRVQTRHTYYLCTGPSWTPQIIFVQNTQFGWLEPPKVYWSSMQTLCALFPDYESDHMRLGCIDTVSRVRTFYSTPDTDAISLRGCFPDSTCAVVLASPTPLDRSLWRISVSNTQSSTKLLSRNMSGWFDGSFSPDGQSFMEQFYGDGSWTAMPYAALSASNGIVFLKDNNALADVLATYNVPNRKFVSVGGLNAVLILPQNFSDTSQYDVLMDVYGGPGSQMVKHRFSLGFDEFMVASKRNVIVAIVDNRGTGARGLKFLMSHTYMKLGQIELEDQRMFANYLLSFRYVTSVSIWGWSYGGFMACMAATDPLGPWKKAIAVAPVTDWRYYDSVYTERYMRTPQANSVGYDNSTIIKRSIESISLQRPFLLAYGTADDNVHALNSAILDLALVSNDIPFTTMTYTNSDHGIVQPRKHLYHLIERFFGN